MTPEGSQGHILGRPAILRRPAGCGILKNLSLDRTTHSVFSPGPVHSAPGYREGTSIDLNTNCSCWASRFEARSSILRFYNSQQYGCEASLHSRSSRWYEIAKQAGLQGMTRVECRRSSFATTLDMCSGKIRKKRLFPDYASLTNQSILLHQPLPSPTRSSIPVPFQVDTYLRDPLQVSCNHSL